VAIERPVDILNKRLADLDEDSADRFRDDPDRDLMQFIWVMDAYSEPRMGPPGWAVLAAGEADRLVSSSLLLSKMSKTEQPIVDGSLAPIQHWVTTERHRSPNESLSTPSRSKFEEPHLVQNARSSSRSARTVAFHTCTPAFASGNGMWEIYLDLYPSGAPLRPWWVWSLHVIDDRVAEITSASEWVKFIDRYGTSAAGLVYPDWLAASADFAGVHVTVRAVAAVQGFSFETQLGLTAPMFWDVEQTMWLKWGFDSVQLVRRYE
jgi:hypothetical protein